MHEMAVTKGILQTVTASLSPGDKVVTIDMEVGEFHNYEPVWMQKYFTMLSKGTPAENAELRVKRIPLKFACKDCGEEFSLDIKSEGAMVCPKCDSRNYKMIAGREFFITQIEVETE